MGGKPPLNSQQFILLKRSRESFWEGFFYYFRYSILDLMPSKLNDFWNGNSQLHTPNTNLYFYFAVFNCYRFNMKKKGGMQ